MGASPGLLKETEVRISETAERVEANHEVGEKKAVGEMKRYNFSLLLLVACSSPGPHLLPSLPSPPNWGGDTGHYTVEHGAYLRADVTERVGGGLETGAVEFLC